MQLKEFSVTLGQLITEFQFELIYGPEGFEKIEITTDDVNRPGLQLAGFFDYFEPQRLQIMGKAENAYVEQFDEEKRTDIFEKLCATGIPAVIVTRNIEVFPELIEAAKKYDVAVLRTNEFTSSVTSALVASLKVSLAPRITLHGVLVELYGEGILILGDSGVGKSETAIELVKRGHRLIADDAVEIKRVSDRTLVGCAPEIIRHFIELRGIGIVDVRRIFGMGAIKETERVDMIINLEQWVEGKMYDRLGMDNQYTDILGLRIPSLTIPVRPGRNLAVIIEVAAMNHRHKSMGYNAAKELNERMMKSMGIQNNT
ncbi:MAG: HPr(Ser) kinase/phosphatase [Butyricicoccus sp.]|uniref:HPr kinase/phosphorylase n=1 Tax=Butyricicoccus intestinisimiae TaxID=2841509 RepID=A0ABS6EXG5_9FIRM|nr:HPr(Ser) kinase/phosphatase [Butyricicoccus intestinisimiae]MBU5491560.1 HPr(Ser) kinase/phosphatase [Butyricicoccus intestinisimiae]MDD7625239.1 HPr(Ser) kinase/phosphatase [Butyricicoccus sp.]MDY4086747.1 HPr(Ser) kinase/phosphatase [Butyricicoccus intestinisimiae]MEE0327045.1 HPr(Ser) kinase/phosphatase [Butyricicoccus sp.]